MSHALDKMSSATSGVSIVREGLTGLTSDQIFRAYVVTTESAQGSPIHCLADDIRLLILAIK
jgi:hypothetical protein